MIISRGEFWRELLAVIAAERQDAVENVGTGSAIDWPDYKERCGFVRGLDVVTDWINDTMSKERGE